MSAGSATSSADLHRLHAERGDILYRHLHRLLARASASEVDTAFREVWRRSLAHGRADPWLTLLRQAYLAAGEHESRRFAPAYPVIAPEDAAAGHAAWLAIATPPAHETLTDAKALAQWHQLGDGVVAAIGDLPLHHRAAILLHHDLMLPLADIALVLQQAPQTVGSLVWEALLQVRSRVGAGWSATAHG